MQPAAFFGRYPWRLEEAPRLTLPEVMAALAQQAPEMVSPSHLHPPGCENELCSFSAVYRRVRKDGAPSLEWLADAGQSCCSPAPQAAAASVPPSAQDGARKAKQFVALHWKGGSSGGEPTCACGGAASASSESLEGNTARNMDGDGGGSNKGNADADGFSRFLAQAGAEQRFTLSAMAFQDALSLDLDRVRGCCIHVVRPDGRMIPFCLHNLTASDGTRLYGDAT